MTDTTEHRLAELLRLLPPPPVGWVQAAQELPRARAQLDGIAERAAADAAYRARVLADLEAALRETGVEPSRPVVERLRKRLRA